MFQTTNQCLLVSSQIYYIRRARAPGSYKLIDLSIIIVIICYNSHKPENIKLPI